MSIIVQKYGGTSLRGLGENNSMLKHVKQVIEEGHKLVIVVSAIGRKGEAYATDTLLEQLYTFSKKVHPKKADLIMSCGETMATAIVSHYLEVNGFATEPLLGFQAGIVTDENFNSGNILDIQTEKILKHLEEDKIVVIAGFQGVTKDLDITTLGRGGSDTTAVALAGFLNAERVDIYTDVPGVTLLDPKLAPNAKYIKNISYDNMYTFASNGAKVIHPRAVSIGKTFTVPIRILSTHKDSLGTLISTMDNQNKIIGMTISKGKNHSILSIFLKEEYKDIILDNLREFNKQNKDQILNIEYLEDKIAYVANNKEIQRLAQKLYVFLTKGQSLG